MRFKSAKEFLKQQRKHITLIGMSNVGKTTLASKLRAEHWYHYSVDYRLATKHLRDPIVDTLKAQMMKNESLANHLRQDLMHVDVNVSFDNLGVVSNYLGKLGDPKKGGLSLREFLARQRRHRAAEIAAMMDMPDFIARAHDVYKYQHFVVDASGSVCEIVDAMNDNDPILREILGHSMIVYLEADPGGELRLIQQAHKHPKPLYYRHDFLDQSVQEYLEETNCTRAEEFDADAFIRWVFPRLLRHRIPLYERIAQHGYSVSAVDAANVESAGQFLDLVAESIDKAARHHSAFRGRAVLSSQIVAQGVA